MIQRLFVYGTLAPGRPNTHVLPDIGGSWQSATVTGTLYPEGWGAEMGYPGMVLSESGEDIEGSLFSSENLFENWAMLDEFEGEAYERVLAVAKCKDNSLVETYVYVLRERSAAIRNKQ